MAARVRTPTILQMETTECGAAALGMVLAHHGRWVPLEDLRVACGVSRDGSRASHLVRAARDQGLVAKGLRLELEKIGELPLPAVLFWGFNHFVVLEGVGPKGLWINDPARGPRLAGWDEADGAFTGVALTFEPGPDFVREGAAPSVVRSLAARVRGAVGPLALCVLAGIGLLVPGLLVPAAVQVFVNQYLGAGHTEWLWPILGGAAAAAVVSLALTWIQQITLLRLALKLSISMSVRFFEHVLRLPLAFFGQRYAGHVVTRVGLNDEVASVLSSQLAVSLLSFVTSLFYLILMAVYDWQLTLITVGFSAASLVALQVVARRQSDLGRLLVQDGGILTATAAAGLENIETLKATSGESAFFARWAGQQADLVGTMQALGAQTSMLASLPVLAVGLNTAAVLGYGGLQVMDGNLSIGALAAFQVLAAGFTAPIGQLVGFGQTLQQTAGNLAAIDDVVRYPEQEAPPSAPAADLPAARRRRRPSGALELVDVAFGYHPLDPPFIDGLSLRVEPGSRVAIVGPTGSGKSTVARLVAGLHKPWRGTILVDGVPRDEIPRRELASVLAFVDQDIRLFQATVRENITLFDATIPDEAVVRAATDAVVHEEIVRRPGGYDRAVQEDGRDWSGGQRQRLEIARALAVDPALVVLDEATSALDARIEREIDRNLRARGCGVLLVAHRLSTIRDCDEIIVLDRGAVVQRGTHDELLAAGGLYADLVLEPAA